MRLMGECSYKAGSWKRERRVLYKAEVMDEGTNTRFVVTPRGGRHHGRCTSDTSSGEKPKIG